ncbi:Opacity protein and related surface antigens [Serratia fonticola]|uniref:Opacity protein and related surface antigens n=1 Tax=Serratia fonticola TaxID=47917 RepID=A0A4U9W090_SERFO|nr:Opacity protein and related surface antigens [Serratia fonticola]
MLNAYRDYALGYDFSVYGTVGLGIAKVKSDGWQGNTSRQYAASTQNNLAYSIGAGISYAAMERLNLDLGYRYVDMGKIESGYNNFTNARGLKDEQMKARLVSSGVCLRCALPVLTLSLIPGREFRHRGLYLLNNPSGSSSP